MGGGCGVYALLACPRSTFVRSFVRNAANVVYSTPRLVFGELKATGNSAEDAAASVELESPDLFLRVAEKNRSVVPFWR